MFQDGAPVIIGAGAAGLMAALSLAPQKSTVLCAGALGQNAASGWAQGGIAAAIGPDDTAALHAADTIAAGAGLCDSETVARIIEAGPKAIATLQQYGANFATGLGLEAAHSRRRIVHAADATGAEIMRALITAARATPSITILEHAAATELVVRDNTIASLHITTQTGPLSIATNAVIIATGGIGGLFAHTTNPRTATGTGLALAARAGAHLRDMEFVQFHPTALGCGLDPMPLVSEALRGEGAVFVDDQSTPFMHGRDLAARDIAARAVAAKIAAGGSVFLDATRIDAAKFPAIFATCRANNIDPATQPIPVRPAAHYHMGGIAVNTLSESSIHGLFACGEAAATGLHGANRLASNSLLEAIVTARNAAETITGRTASRRAQLPSPTPPRAATPLSTIRELCSRHLGILRNAEGIATAITHLTPLAETSNPALAALLIANAAYQRTESRGAHHRTDFPATNPAFATSYTTSIPVMRHAA